MSNASNIKKDIITAKGFTIQVYTEDFRNDYVSLTDIARYKNKEEPKDVVKNWLRVKNTIEFLGLWESINNPNFKGVEFDSFKNEAGSNAFKFAAWISAEFELYIIKDYQRLKSDEGSRLSLNWNLNREISKINYKIHTDAIKEYLLKDLTSEQLMYKYANEADLLNVALFNKTAKQWRDANPKSKGNIRDEASINELLVLANMESYNAVLISKGLPQADRMAELRNLARTQILSLENLNNPGIKSLDSVLKN